MSNNFFLLGSERSGTNLLRTILDNHSEIASPIPLQTLYHFYDLEPYYGDLSQDDLFLILIKDIIGLINSLRSWGVEFDENKILKDIPDTNRSVMAIFEYMLNEYCAANNKRRWFCKDINLARYIFPIKEYFLNPKFIYLVRDPRDVYLSMRNSYNLFPKTAIEFANRWKKEQHECIQIFSRQPFNKQILLIKYEDMISDSMDCFEKICNFLGVKFENEMLFSQKRDESLMSSDWKNLSGQIIKGNIEKYKNKLRMKDIAIIEHIAHREMLYLGYFFDLPDMKIRIGRFARIRSKLVNRVIIKYKYNFLMKFRNSEEYRLRMKERAYIKSIRNRLNYN